MAIYKNREVTVIGPNNQASTPDTMNIRYKDGTHENVAVADIYFSDDEKKTLIKNHPSQYENVKVATPQDIESVQAGVAPPSDASYKAKAEHDLAVAKQKELSDKNAEMAKAEAEKQSKEVAKAQPKPTPTPVAVKPDSKLPWVK